MSPSSGAHITSVTLTWSILSLLVLLPELRTVSAPGERFTEQQAGQPGTVTGERLQMKPPMPLPTRTEPWKQWRPGIFSSPPPSTPAVCPSLLLPILPHPASPLPTSLSTHFPRVRTNKKTSLASVAAVAARGAGSLPSFPGFPDPDLNPHSASCQPGCSQADIAAGAFSPAFPQICLLWGLLKRSQRFLCYSRLHTLPSSKAWLPGASGRGGSRGSARPGASKEEGRTEVAGPQRVLE